MLFRNEIIHLYTNDDLVIYRKWLNEYHMDGCRVEYEHRREFFVENKMPLEVVTNDLSALLNDQRLTLNEFEVLFVDCQKKAVDTIESVLNQIGSLSAKWVSIKGASPVKTAKLLQRFETGALKKLNICIDWSYEESVEHLVGLEQWKAVKTLYLYSDFYGFIKHLRHLNTLIVDCVGETLSNKDISKFRDESFL